MDRLMKGSDNRPGPRIAMAYNEEYHDFFLAHGRIPGPVAYSNTGVFLIKPGLITITNNENMEGKFSFIFKDVDEFLYLINLKALNMVNPIPEFSIHEMGFINEVYIYERLDLGLPYNFMHFNLVNDDFL